MAAKGKKADRPVRKPEKKFGPFYHGVGVAIWLNSVETEQGTRYFRSITLAPRRYRAQDGQWRDAKSYRAVDLPVLVLALQAAHDYIVSTPLPGQPVEGEEYEELHLDQGEVENNQPMP